MRFFFQKSTLCPPFLKKKRDHDLTQDRAAVPALYPTNWAVGVGDTSVTHITGPRPGVLDLTRHFRVVGRDIAWSRRSSGFTLKAQADISAPICPLTSLRHARRIHSEGVVPRGVVCRGLSLCRLVFQGRPTGQSITSVSTSQSLTNTHVPSSMPSQPSGSLTQFFLTLLLSNRFLIAAA